MEFNPKYDITKLQDSENINEMLSEDESAYIGRRVVEGYDADERSRDKWREKMQDSLELALQVTKQKTYPWAGAANVKFPLLTIASLQFASRAYPALVKAPQVAKMRKTGDDLQGQKAAAADRVSAHMSWQLLEQDEQWLLAESLDDHVAFHRELAFRYRHQGCVAPLTLHLQPLHA